ncbi:MAG: Type 1 glutamine amidotransferase-like domain-containing protein [Bacillus sp. (in: firmicutes)]
MNIFLQSCSRHLRFSHSKASHLTQRDFLKENAKDFATQQDVIYVGGGNTQFMLSKWRETNFDKVLKEAYEKGTLLAGISAGAMCWFETCFSERHDGAFEEFEGLGFLKGAFCPHYNEEIRRKAYDNWQTTKSIRPSYTLADNENLHFRNENLLARIII